MANSKIYELRKRLKKLDNSYLFKSTGCGYYHLSISKGFVTDMAIALVLEYDFCLLGVDFVENYILFSK